ncbi:TM0106 family RecB-like putative nuclease [Bradyrhizobium japonicum]|uniref:TM0106 family RecB-like putative nuclease n=1 Tax=Bradyrhizobium japonicum TaxID=375 RepID=UPI003391DD26
MRSTLLRDGSHIRDERCDLPIRCGLGDGRGRLAHRGGGSMKVVTASILYDLVECPKRVSLDAFGEASRRDETNAFVRLMWERGTLFEGTTVAALRLPFVDLSNAADTERESLTLQAMTSGAPLIYGGRISMGDLLGHPDLLRKEPEGYVPGDIKCGHGKEAAADGENGKPKLSYAVQLACYVEILERLGRAAGRRAFVLDIEGKDVEYDFVDSPAGRNLWRVYEKAVAAARSILYGGTDPLPAYCGACKLCHWHSFCLEELTAADDLTLIAGLHRRDRDAMRESIPSIAAFAALDPETFVKGKKTAFAGIGADRLRALHARAVLLKRPDPKPYLRKPVRLEVFPLELFFDVEVDPLRDICYVHGILERRDGDCDNERYVAFFARDITPAAERDAFAAALAYFARRPDAAIYHYSKYERSTYRRLQRKYSDVCSRKEVDRLFDPTRATDLYGDVVLKATEWPTRDRSIKSLARYLGFAWRDPQPSGAASVAWYDSWCTHRSEELKQRILDYNADDCRATRIVLDGIRSLAPA